LGARSIGPGEGQRQADDEPAHAMGVDQSEKTGYILAKAASPDRLERRGDDAAGVRQSEADRLRPDIEAHQPYLRRHRLAQLRRIA
jgi:hypothetical protein